MSSIVGLSTAIEELSEVNSLLDGYVPDDASVFGLTLS